LAVNGYKYLQFVDVSTVAETIIFNGTVKKVGFMPIGQQRS